MSSRGPSSSSGEANTATGGSGSATDPASTGHDSHVSDPALEKPEPTFTSSRSIALEGNSLSAMAPMEGVEVEVQPSLSHSSLDPSTNTKRTPRKSKMDALAALNRSRSPSVEVVNSQVNKQGTPASALNGVPISVSSTLDMSTVKTIGPRNIGPRTKPRIFGLEDCPTYYPSPEEFKDPLGYIRSISPEGREYGIIKIVPPIGWKMPFVIDTEVNWCGIFVVIHVTDAPLCRHIGSRREQCDLIQLRRHLEQR